VIELSSLSLNVVDWRDLVFRVGRREKPLRWGSFWGTHDPLPDLLYLFLFFLQFSP